MGHERVEQAKLQVSQTRRALAPYFHDTVDGVQGQTFLAQRRQAPKSGRCQFAVAIRACTWTMSKRAQRPRHHQVRAGLQESEVEVFSHRIDDQDDGHRRLSAGRRTWARGSPLMARATTSAGSLQPALQGPVQVVRGGYSQARRAGAQGRTRPFHPHCRPAA